MGDSKWGARCTGAMATSALFIVPSRPLWPLSFWEVGGGSAAGGMGGVQVEGRSCPRTVTGRMGDCAPLWTRNEVSSFGPFPTTQALL